jgi:hypothetical protein
MATERRGPVSSLWRSGEIEVADRCRAGGEHGHGALLAACHAYQSDAEASLLLCACADAVGTTSASPS